MSDQRDGRSFLVPPNRRLTWDLMWFNKSVPQCGHDIVCDLSKLAEARAACSIRVSWPALFLKAYGLVAAEFPELRQTWYRWPWGHLYQHSCSVGVVTVHRQHDGDPWLFWGLIPQPENLPLSHIQETIDGFTSEEPCRVFRRQLQLARLPTVFRRLIWGWNVHVAKAKRAKRLGTFFLSTLSSRGVEIQMPPAIQTGCLTFGPLDDRGSSRITLAYDHRVMDGVSIAEILTRLKTVLLGTLRTELLQVPHPNDNIQFVA